jgi:hypothetical protein
VIASTTACSAGRDGIPLTNSAECWTESWTVVCHHLQAEAMAQRYTGPLQQLQQRQQQQQPWEGRGRQDPRAAGNSTGRTPCALALAARRSKALLLLLDPTLPLSWVLTAAGLMGRGLFGAPKLAVSWPVRSINPLDMFLARGGHRRCPLSNHQWWAVQQASISRLQWCIAKQLGHWPWAAVKHS